MYEVQCRGVPLGGVQEYKVCDFGTSREKDTVDGETQFMTQTGSPKWCPLGKAKTLALLVEWGQCHDIVHDFPPCRASTLPRLVVLVYGFEVRFGGGNTRIYHYDRDVGREDIVIHGFIHQN